MTPGNTPIQSGFFHQDEEIAINSVLSSEEKGVFGIFTGLFSETEEDVSNVIDKIWSQIRWENVDCMTIDTHIETIGREVQKILTASEMFTKKGIDKAITSVEYRVYLHWIKEVLKDCGFGFNGEVNDVENSLSEEIYNLLQTKRLTSFFLFLKSYGILDYSSNIINDWEKEKELKILEIDKENLISKLQEIGAEKGFEGELQDDYFDYPNLELDRGGDSKRSFRIRKRTMLNGDSDYYYTIKRKINGDDKARTCYEKEFEIKEFDLFRKVLGSFGLRNSRSKTQQRISYQLVRDDVQVKFDICTYEGIPTFLEIECDSQDHIDSFIEELGLNGNKTLNKGSRGLYEYYQMYDEYDKNYKVANDNKSLIWDKDGEKFDLASSN